MAPTGGLNQTGAIGGLNKGGLLDRLADVSGFNLTNQGATVGIPDSGVSRWTFDSADTDTGTALDSWGSNDGTINGATTGVAGANQTYATNEAYSFDGTDDYINISNPSVPSELTVSFWVNFDSLSQEQHIVDLGINTDVGGADVSYEPTDNAIVLNYEDGSGLVSVNGPDVSTGVWYNIIATVNSTDSVVYLDGVSQATGAGGSISDTSRDWRIGQASFGGKYFVGDIDDVRIYDKALTSQEVTNLYNNGDIRVS